MTRKYSHPLHAAAIALITLVLAGCAGTPEPVSLAPNPEFSKSDAGAGQTVALRVMDTRKDTAIGRRDPAFGDRRPIQSAEDVSGVLQNHIAEGLRAQGFMPAPYSDSATRRLTVRLEKFAYETSSAVVTSKVAVRSAMAIEAVGPNQRFQRRFATESTDRVAFSPGKKGREKAVNAALTDLIEGLFADPTLLEVLTAP